MRIVIHVTEISGEKILKNLKILMLLALMISLLAFAGCDDDPDFVEAIVFYDLHVQNNTDTDFDLFMEEDVDTSGYWAAGQVEAQSSTTIDDLAISVYYNLRLSLVGESADDYVYEYSVRSVDHNDQYITIGQ